MMASDTQLEQTNTYGEKQYLTARSPHEHTGFQVTDQNMEINTKNKKIKKK